ncbi:MAG: hypothetical protein GC164_12265 [Phycisphaera sp.]|nr:hypothetical protein [Phycisphaera sp.]
MEKALIRTCVVCALLVVAGTLKANTITLIDYSPAVLNGGFESVTGFQADGWVAGLDVANSYVDTNNLYTNIEGNVRLGIDTTGVGGLQDTGHTVATGETFSLEFDWTSAYAWGVGDSIIWKLLTTSDNTTAGTVNEIASGSVNGKEGNGGQWGTSVVLTDGGTITAANEGKNLWVEIYGSPAGGDTRYAFVDKVRLSVDTPVVNIPEPASLAAALVGLVMVTYRRS